IGPRRDLGHLDVWPPVFQDHSTGGRLMLTRVRKTLARVLGYGHSRGDIHAASAAAMEVGRRLHATYDAALTSAEFKNYWANADALDADSANSREVRQKLVQRSRYEVANNAYADGIAQTITNDLVGVG